MNKHKEDKKDEELEENERVNIDLDLDLINIEGPLFKERSSKKLSDMPSSLRNAQTYEMKVREERKSLLQIAEEEELEWILKPFPDKMVNIIFTNGHRYEGRMSRNKMEGEGIFSWNDGSRYEGEFQENQIKGKGVLEWPDLSYYSGEFKEGIRHGLGTFCSSSSAHVYSGDWICGIREGFGWARFSADSKNWYNGEWQNGLPHGMGIRQYPSGGRYMGHWKEGKRHGLGTMVWSNGNVYRGEWADGEMDGYGEYTWIGFVNSHLAHPAQNYYCGGWKKGLRDGLGSLQLVNGANYCGYWKNGLKEGKGEVTCSNGTHVCHQPLFEQDKPSICVETEIDTAYSEKKESLKQVVKETAYERRMRNWNKRFLTSTDELQPDMPKPKVIPRDFFFSRQFSTAADIINVRRVAVPFTKGSQEIEVRYYIYKLFKARGFRVDVTPTSSSASWPFSSSGAEEYTSLIHLPNAATECHDWDKFLNQSKSKRNCSLWESDISENSDIDIKNDEVYYDEEMENEQRLLKNAILSNLPYLHWLYEEYATVACTQRPTYRAVLSRLGLWQLLRDCQISRLGLSLVQFDEILAVNPLLLIEEEHFPFERIYFWKFLHCIIELAWILFGIETLISINEKHHNYHNFDEIIRKRGVLGHVVTRLINEVLKRNAKRHVGHALFEMRDVIPIEPLYIFFRGLGEPLTARKLLNYICVPKGQPLPPKDYYQKKIQHKYYPPHMMGGYNTVSFGNDIWYRPQDPPLMFSYLEPQDFKPKLEEQKESDTYFDTLYSLRDLGPKGVIACLCEVCPSIRSAETKAIINMCYKMCFLEFYEVLILMIKRKMKKEVQMKALAARIEKNRFKIKKKARGSTLSRERKGEKFKYKIK